MKNDTEDTIAAISTPLGEGGIGIVRISGSKSFDILKKLFVPKNKSLKKFQSHRVYMGQIVSLAGDILDEALVTTMHAPKTYTTEDMIEINCHGGIEVLNLVLKEILKTKDARIAEGGEFTKRAFLNGRLDLMQAEAVIDIIRAKSDIALKNANKRLVGHSSKELTKIKQQLIDIITALEASLDFPEDVDFDKTISKKIDQLEATLGKILKQMQKIKLLKEGVRIAIIGKPNAGKSTLLNAILGKDRAIVTEIPGTTRDTLEEPFKVEGIPVVITDTAGLRHTEETIEKEGVKRTQKEIKQADLILYVIDINSTADEDKQNLKEINDYPNTLFIINKIDLPHALNMSELNIDEKNAIFVSAKENLGIVELKEHIRNFIINKKMDVIKEDIIISNIRHEELVSNALKNIQKAKTATSKQMSEEFILFDLKNALQNIGEMIGEVTTDDILNKIFSEFCIGK